MCEIFGDFREDLPETDHEFLKIGFSPSSMPIKQRWRNNGLSADFAADYLTTFFPVTVDNPASRRQQAEIKNAVSYIANELLENAMKYSIDAAKYPIKFSLHLLSEGSAIRVVLKTINSVSSQNLEKLHSFIQEFLAANPEEFYVQQLEKSAADETSSASGLGLITMKNDYQAELGWKIERCTSDRSHESITTVTTMVQLKV